ncbi:alpha/beta hydrolase [Jidongwangia harbinensis]|uniref:alpha/beta hydrolase n=1 Tax=Jidongwangia harbinensis TaxID=2878561 RepID=UPI001CDA2BDD|nr:alpha/beta hydrolase [Jidongwangia harbinensis]MCA2211885.1 alpha/beta hydrolase [Jidongwangia harbinensis]
MTTTTSDPNRARWAALARDEPQTPAWETLATDPDGVATVRVETPAGLWLRPPDAPAGPVIMAIHGGGFVSGSAATHRRMFGHLARAAGVETFAVEYGLVPEHVFPGQLDTVTAAYRWLLGRGAGPIAVAGDSCGATLAIGLAVRLRAEDLPMPASLLLLSAWTDLEADGTSYDTGSDPFFTRELVRGLAADYLAGADPHDPLAAPIHADPRGLPPAYLQVGAEEALLDDSRRLARRMRAAGVEVRLDEFPGQVHTFQMAAGRTSVADEAVREAGSWLRSTLVR